MKIYQQINNGYIKGMLFYFDNVKWLRNRTSDYMQKSIISKKTYTYHTAFLC